MNEQDPISTDDRLQIYQQQQRRQQQQQQQPRQTTTTSAPATPPAGGSQPRVSGAKPVRKRSRESKKAPTTLLNTSSINFRALVQQFTGCSSGGSSSSSNPTNTSPYGKGPLNINFGGPLPEDQYSKVSNFAQCNSTPATSLSQSQHDNMGLIGSADPPNTRPPVKDGNDEFDASLREFMEEKLFDRGSGNDHYFF